MPALSAPASSSSRTSSTERTPPADGERQEHPLGGRAHDVQHRRPPVGRGGDVEEADLVGPLGVVGGGDRHRIAGVAQLLELNALLDPPAVDVEAGDDPLAQHA